MYIPNGNFQGIFVKGTIPYTIATIERQPLSLMLLISFLPLHKCTSIIIPQKNLISLRVY